MDAKELTKRRCAPCEGGVQPLSIEQSRSLLRELPQWRLSDDGESIVRQLVLRNFVEALELCNQIGQLAEEEQHHPDLHVTGYRKLRVELTTHAIGGLSENDFILAAKIDRLIQGDGVDGVETAGGS